MTKLTDAQLALWYVEPYDQIGDDDLHKHFEALEAEGSLKSYWDCAIEGLRMLRVVCCDERVAGYPDLRDYSAVACVLHAVAASAASVGTGEEEEEADTNG